MIRDKQEMTTLALSELSKSTYRFPPGGLSKLAILTETHAQKNKTKK